MSAKFITGFSKLSKEEKLKLISSDLADGSGFLTGIQDFNHKDPARQLLMDQFSENTLGNYPLPYGVAPNFLVNGKFYTVPMVTEESSVVAAAAASARFWADKGGFHATVTGTLKIGQIHFCWNGKKEILLISQEELKVYLLDNTVHLTQNMVDRGGGIREIELIDFSDRMENYFQLRIGFETVDSMGANFINSVLEEMAALLKSFYGDQQDYSINTGPVDVIMSILSNYTPECKVECFVETTLESFGKLAENLTGEQFAEKFKKAVDIAFIDPYRAVTHNKGIFNGIDAVVLATGNDFRAVEAAGHAYAAKSGIYKSLSRVEIDHGIFRMSIELPLAVGVVGGLTSLHPVAKWSFEILEKPDAKELMCIIAAAGLASNFSAVRSLITQGIQKGHMKMHLANILSFLGANETSKTEAIKYFKDRPVSHSEVQKFLDTQKSTL
jgi:hydroxymethylglutaryl-CoA reductase